MTAIILIVVGAILISALIAVFIIWRMDIKYYDERIDKHLLDKWHLDLDNQNLKIEIDRLRKVIMEEEE